MRARASRATRGASLSMLMRASEATSEARMSDPASITLSLSPPPLLPLVGSRSDSLSRAKSPSHSISRCWWEEEEREEEREEREEEEEEACANPTSLSLSLARALSRARALSVRTECDCPCEYITVYNDCPCEYITPLPPTHPSPPTSARVCVSVCLCVCVSVCLCLPLYISQSLTTHPP
jgi:hypothetical protein